MKALHTYFRGDYMFSVCQVDLFGLGNFTTGIGRYKTGYLTLPEGHPAHGVDSDNYPELNMTFGDTHNGYIDFNNRWTFGIDTASQYSLKEYQTQDHIQKRLDEMYDFFKEMDVPNVQTKETADERKEREMLDSMMNGYHSRLQLPDYLQNEADRMDD